MCDASWNTDNDCMRSFPRPGIVHATCRVYPIVGTLFRMTKKDVTYNGYLIPEGEMITWSSAHQMRAPSIYPSPKK